MILTSTEPNISRMLFSINNQKMMLQASCTFGWPNNLSSTWNIDTAGYSWKRLFQAFSVITRRINISGRGRDFWPTKGTSCLQDHKFLMKKKHPKNILKILKSPLTSVLKESSSLSEQKNVTRMNSCQQNGKFNS